MTLFFPDLNVWLALSVNGHVHSEPAWNWMRHLPDDAQLLFARYTQVGLLRLLTNTAAMGARTLTLEEAWSVYDGWLNDPRVQFYPEPRNIDAAFRNATAPFGNTQSSKWIGDCWLLAFAKEAGATLLTFDRALLKEARRQGVDAVIPS